jgi:hypothetical protein
MSYFTLGGGTEPVKEYRKPKEKFWEGQARKSQSGQSSRFSSKNSSISCLSHASLESSMTTDEDYFNQAQRESLTVTSRQSESSMAGERHDSGVEMVTGETRESVVVHSCEKDDELGWIYTLEVRYATRNNQILLRTYNDFWNLHLRLLEDSRRSDTHSRIIPFLDREPAQMTFSQALSKRRHLNFYLNEIQSLSGRGLNPIEVNRFFWPQAGDFNCMADSAASLNAISEAFNQITARRGVNISIINSNRTAEWMEYGGLTMNDLLKRASSILGEPIHSLFYVNELGERSELKTDYELFLLLHGGENIVLYTSIYF